MATLPTSGCCNPCDCECTETSYVQVPGPAGADGAAGAAGAAGADGADAFTQTTADFVMPVVGGTVGVFVDDTSFMYVGMILQVEGAGGMEVTAVGTPVSCTLENLGWAINAAPAANIASGATVAPSGPEGPAGAAGAPDDASYWCRVAEAGLSAESDMSALATGYVRVTTGTGAPSSTATIPLAHINTGAATTAQVLKPDGAGSAVAGQVQDDEIDYTDAGIGALNIDWSAGRYFSKSIGVSSAFTFSNTDTGKEITVAIKNTAGAGVLCTWTHVTAWVGGSVPTQNQSVNGITVYKFSKNTAGDIIGAVLSGQTLGFGSAARLYYTVAAGVAPQHINGAATTTVEFTTETDPSAIVVLAANDFSIDPGTYNITVEVPLYQEDNSAHPFRLELYDVTAATLVAWKSVHLESDTEYTFGWLTHPVVITVPTTYRVRLVTDATANVDIGQAVNLGGVAEIYQQVQIIKL